MKTFEFTIRGKPVPFIAHWNKAPPVRKRRYIEFCRDVQTHAMAAGFRFALPTKDSPLYVHTRAWFEDGRHADPENIHKAIVDALFYRRGKGSKADKYTGGFFDSPRYDRYNPRVDVVITPGVVGSMFVRETIPEAW